MQIQLRNHVVDHSDHPALTWQRDVWLMQVVYTMAMSSLKDTYHEKESDLSCLFMTNIINRSLTCHAL